MLPVDEQHRPSLLARQSPSQSPCGTLLRSAAPGRGQSGCHPGSQLQRTGMTLLQQTLLLNTARLALSPLRSLPMAAHLPLGLPVAAAALARGGALRKQALSRGW